MTYRPPAAIVELALRPGILNFLHGRTMPQLNRGPTKVGPYCSTAALQCGLAADSPRRIAISANRFLATRTR